MPKTTGEPLSERATKLSRAAWNKVRGLLLLLACGLLLGACGAQSADPDVGTETHWLDQCDSDAECGGLECLCGRCTLPCDDSDGPRMCRDNELQCIALPGACGAVTIRAACANSAANFTPLATDASVRNDASTSSSNDVEDSGRDVPAPDQRNVLGLPVGTCDAQGWCWQSPTPVGDLFYAITDDGKYAAGEFGAVVELPGRYLQAASEDVGFIEHTNDGLFGVTASGLVVYSEESGWTLERAGNYNGTALSDSGQLWLLASDGVEHQQDGQWRVDALPASADPEWPWYSLDIAVLDEDTVWVLASDFAQPKIDIQRQVTVFQLRQGEWTELPAVVVVSSPDWRFLRVGSAAYVHDPDASTTRDIYDVADAWSVVVTKPTEVNAAVFAATDGTLLGSGSDGTYAFDLDGSRKLSNTECKTAVPEGDSAIRCVAWGGGLPLLDLDAEPPAVDLRLPLDTGLFGQIPVEVWAQGDPAWASGPDDAWREGFEHFDGMTWTSFVDDVPVELSGAVLAIDGSAPDNVWFAGVSTLLRFDGETFETIPTGSEEPTFFLPALRSFGPDDTWVIRTTDVLGQVLHFDGEQWTETLSVDPSLKNEYFILHAALSGKDSTDLWAALGDSAYHLEMGEWRKVCELPGATFSDLAYDDGELWLSDRGVAHQLDSNGRVIARGKPSGGAQGFGLTNDYVWQFGFNVRTLER